MRAIRPSGCDFREGVMMEYGNSAVRLFTELLHCAQVALTQVPRGLSCLWLMKTLHLLFLTGASLFAMAHSLPAQTKPQATPADPFIKNPGDAATAGKQGDIPLPNYMLVLETYTMDKNDALALLESERGSTARYRRVTDLVKSGKAKLDILTALAARSGDRSSIEGVDEVRYATEFAPPKAKGGLAAPTAFETRNVGDTLEFESMISRDGRICDLSLNQQRVGLVGFRDIGGMAEDSIVSQPRFDVQQITTSVSFPINEPHYLGSSSPTTSCGSANADTPSEMRLAFVRFNSLTPSAEESKAPAKPMDWSAVNLEYRTYSLDRAAALEILVTMPDLQTPWNKLQGLLTEKKARFEHLVSLQTKVGQRAVTEEVQEVRYATEYANADRPTSVETTTRTSTTRPGFAEAGAGGSERGIEGHHHFRERQGYPHHAGCGDRAGESYRL